MTLIKHFHNRLLNLSLTISLLWLSFALAWLVLSAANFNYSFWYKQLNVKEHIQRYAPQNRMGKGNFVLTGSKQHSELFASVVSSINKQGDGLAKIQYQAATKNHALFTQAEVIHLQDVANLITLGKKVSVFVLILALVLLVYIGFKAVPLYSFKKQALSIIGLVAGLALLVLIIGAEKVFYWLHVKIFPHEHQWFFLYQESLMATFMKAPDLFAPIALEWLVLALAIWFALCLGVRQLLKKALPQLK